MRRFLPFFLLPLALGVIGPCTAKAAPDQRPILPEQQANPPIEGVLTNEGLECPALHANDGRLYTLTGNLNGFKPHDRVSSRRTMSI